jgi:ATP-dependent exoDNAse (exonuclease V) alpha subunit
MGSVLAASEIGDGVQARPPESEHAYGRALSTPLRELRGVVERIVATFGEKTLTLIDAHPDRLRQVPGIGPVRAQRIAATWMERRHIREVTAALQSFGLSTSLAVRIYEQFGAVSGAILPLAVDLVAVDEASMLDVLLANQLVKALDPGTHLLLVGDPDQLPSVGAGEVLADLLGSGRFPGTRLTHLFRQSAGSGIALNAQRILAGELPRFGASSGDCFFLRAEEPKATAALVVDLVTRRLSAKYGFGLGDVQVLAPMHRGEAGVSALNQRLQERFNAAQEGMLEAMAGGRVYRPGDRVLQLRNDYEFQVFNGDLGTVQRIDPLAQELQLALDDGRQVCYPYAALFALTHAYAISVHKAQGAEFPAVVIPLLTNHATNARADAAVCRAHPCLAAGRLRRSAQSSPSGRARLAAGPTPHRP